MRYTNFIWDRIAVLLAAVVAGAATLPAHADLGDQLFKLLAEDGAAGDQFGRWAAIDGNIAIVGAYEDQDNGRSSGSAYLFDTTTGEQLFKLLANDGAPFDWFGTAVAISGNTAIVGAQGHADNGGCSGAAYLFDTTTGQQIFKLLADDGAVGDLFGLSVGISGTTAIVGAPLDDDNGRDLGSAYLFDISTGQQLFELLPVGGRPQYTGTSVAIGGTIAVVGSPSDNNKFPQSGSVYLFDTTTGEQIATLLADDGEQNDHLGIAVAISGTTVIAGAPDDDDNGSQSGSAYLFDISDPENPTQIAKLLASDGAEFDHFGDSVGISGGIAIVGAWGNDDNGSQSGSAYLFDISDPANPTQIAKLLADDGAEGDEFGFAVGISGTTALIGAFGDDDKGTNAGSAYIFDVSSSTSTPATLIDVTRTLGLYISGGVPELLASDDTYYVLQSGPGFDPSEPHPARANFRFDSLGFPASTLDITLEEKANIGGPTAVVLLRNRVNAEWDEIARHSLSPIDQTFEMTGIPAAEYISATNGRINVRVRTFAILILNPTIRGIFSHDFVGVTMRE